MDFATSRYCCSGDFDIYQRYTGVVWRGELNVDLKNPGGTSRGDELKAGGAPFFCKVPRLLF